MTLEPNERTKLRQFLRERFSLDELKDLAFDLGIDFQSLPHQTTQELARELISYVDRRGQTGCLVTEALARRPDSQLRQMFTELLSAPATPQSSFLALTKALASEIQFNLSRIEEFIQREYRVDNNKIYSRDGEGAFLDYFTCMTSVFDSSETQKVLALMEEGTRAKLFQVYGGFREINDRADALKHAFRPWRASLYVEAVEDFRTKFCAVAEKLSTDLGQ